MTQTQLQRRRGWRILLALSFAALALLPLTTSAASSLGAQTLTTTENDVTNSFLSTTCVPNAANAIFTSGGFALGGVVNDSGVALTSLLTGDAAAGVAPNQVSGSVSYLGAHANAFVNFTGQLKCDGPHAGHVTSLVGLVYIYDSVGSSVKIYKFAPTTRTATLTLDFTQQTLALAFDGALQRVS